MSEAEEFNTTQAALFEEYGCDDIEFMFEKEEFEAWLHKVPSKRQRPRTARSIFSICQKAQRAFVGMGGYLSKDNLKTYKRNLVDNDLAPATINSIISALATYTQFLADKYKNRAILNLRVKQVQVEPKQYIDNVISRADYDFLVNTARETAKPNIYLGIRIMGTTGVRLCELLQVKVEHIKLGYIDVLGKGAKKRRVYFPKRAKEELLDYLSKLDGGDSGYVIRKWGKNSGEDEPFTAKTRELGNMTHLLTFQRSFQSSLQRFGKKCGIDAAVMHAHGFRHFFAKEFLKNRLDISLLADLLGHSSLDITRIYLKMTSKEQATVIDDTVTW